MCSFRCCACIARISPIARSSEARVWRELPQPSAPSERRVGILGLGVLGSEAALRARGAGLRRRRLEPARAQARRAFALLLRQGRARRAGPRAATSWSACCRSRRETEGILDARLFAALPRGAAIVNCGARRASGRGRSARRARRAASSRRAVLDVVPRRAAAAGASVLAHPRIVVTPHAAAATNAAHRRAHRRRGAPPLRRRASAPPTWSTAPGAIDRPSRPSRRDRITHGQALILVRTMVGQCAMPPEGHGR